MKLLKFISFSLIIISLAFGCKKPKEGYLSNVIVYSPNTINALKGRVTTSAALLVDGSTNPLSVKLTGVRNFYTKRPADSILLKPYEIAVYKGEVVQADSTPEMVAAKIGKAMYNSFKINELGGRMEITPATNFIDTGSYEFDIEVSNIAGIRSVKNAGVIRITNPTTSYTITSQSVTTSPTTAETTTAQTNFTTTVVRTNATENKVIFKFVDKNGVAFNPKTQIISRADRPDFKTYAPFYAEEKTDTALVYKYPPNLPTFPIYQEVTVGSTVFNYVAYYRIRAAATDIGLNLNPVFGVRLWPQLGEISVTGTYLVTFRMNFVAKK